MSKSLYSRTPEVQVFDNRGLGIRKISYHRHPNLPDVTSENITRHQFDTRGFLSSSTDPRLYDVGLANFNYLTDISGSVLRSIGVDNDTIVSLKDSAGRPLVTVSNIYTNKDGTININQSIIQTWEYENAELTGRLLSITVKPAFDIARTTDRFIYGGCSKIEKDLNLAGRCISHYDTAGRQQTNSISLTGESLSVSRNLLKDEDVPVNWLGEDTSNWNDRLVTKSLITMITTDACGAVRTTTDAKGNVQHMAYDVAGQLSGSWLTVKGGSEQVIIKSIVYSAANQKLREEHGNGVVTTYMYESETQRLLGVKMERPMGHLSGAKVLQDLRYEYDPVGNILKITNNAEGIHFWRNQKVAPENTYVYDSQYQLVSATGREMANSGQQRCNQSNTMIFDSATYTNYARTYTYDNAGNLIQIHHHSPATNNSYTMKITISDCSNRGVLNTITSNPSEVDSFFTVGGLQKQLQPGQTLEWTSRNELLKVTPVQRDGSRDDTESYYYDGSSQRVLKKNIQKTNSSFITQQVVYLPGIELRTTTVSNKRTEDFQVICMGKAGRAQVRILHWEVGKPEGLSNDQIRYSYDNLTGSSELELDAEGQLISLEEYYPYGGSAVMFSRNQIEANYKIIRYSGKERDSTGLYYYGFRYYISWMGRWLSTDPVGTIDGLNLYRMAQNNPINNIDIQGLVSAEDLPDSVLLAIGYKQGPYTEYQHEVYGYSNDGERAFRNVGWSNDNRINTFSSEIFDVAESAQKELLSLSVNDPSYQNLTVDETSIIFLYSQESLPFHAWTANHNIGLDVPDKYKTSYHAGQTGELARALGRLTPYQGISHRGALLGSNTYYAANETEAKKYTEIPDSTVFNIGDLVTTHGFFSTSRSREVASQFVFRQRFGNVWQSNTVIFNIHGRTGVNIAQFAELQQAEILFSPGSTFKISSINRTDFGYSVDISEIDANIAWDSGVEIRDYQRGYTKGRRPTAANYY